MLTPDAHWTAQGDIRNRHHYGHHSRPIIILFLHCINKELLSRHLPEFEDAIYYVAGPLAMVTGMRQMLAELASTRTTFRMEEFAGC